MSPNFLDYFFYFLFRQEGLQIFLAKFDFIYSQVRNERAHQNKQAGREYFQNLSNFTE